MQPETISFAAEGPVDVVDIMGRSSTLQPVEGRVSLTLDEYPVFVTGVTRVSGKPFAAGVVRVDVHDPLVLHDVSMNVAEKHFVATLHLAISDLSNQGNAI